jgi:flagellar basal-body rod protein FlgB
LHASCHASWRWNSPGIHGDSSARRARARRPVDAALRPPPPERQKVDAGNGGREAANPCRFDGPPGDALPLPAWERDRAGVFRPRSPLARLLLLGSRGHTRNTPAMFDNVFGIHERALLLRGERVGVLAANIANADTPNYKAKDLDFAAVLSGEQASATLPMAATRAGHLAGVEASAAGGEIKYRIPFQNSLDGNTVEAPVEQAQFAQNAVRYQASLNFINRRISSLELAITGQ